MKFTKKEMKYIAMGMQVEEARRKGGMTILKTLGKEHFSKLGKASAEKRKELKRLKSEREFLQS